MTVRRRMRAIALAMMLLAVPAVALAGQGAGPAKTPAKSKPAAPASKPAVTLSPAIVSRAWTGDFDGMVKRRLIRILTPYNKTMYFIDKGVPLGAIYDVAVKVEETINTKLKTTHATKVHVVVVPTTRDSLYDALVQGRGDIIAAGVTVTPERAKLVDFTIPTKTKVKEIVVTGPGAPALTTVDSLAGVRRRGPREEHSVRDAPEAERHLQAAGQGADPHPNGPDGARGRRRPRNDERRSAEGRGRRRYLRDVLETDPAGYHAAPGDCGARGRRLCVGRAKEQSQAHRGA